MQKPAGSKRQVDCKIVRHTKTKMLPQKRMPKPQSQNKLRRHKLQTNQCDIGNNSNKFFQINRSSVPPHSAIKLAFSFERRWRL